MYNMTNLRLIAICVVVFSFFAGMVINDIDECGGDQDEKKIIPETGVNISNKKGIFRAVEHIPEVLVSSYAKAVDYPPKISA